MHLKPFRGRAIILTALSFGLIFSCKKDTTPTPPTTPTDVNLKKGLLVYLPFDGVIADSSGNSNTTTALGNASLTYDEHGKANSAFGGTGNGERIQVTNNGSIVFDTAFSISMDFMTRGIGSNIGRQVLTTMVDNNTGLGPSFLLGPCVYNTNNVIFAVIDSASTCSSYGSDHSTNDTTLFTPQPEAWYNIIAIFHKGTLQVFVNGKLISTQTGASTKAHICPASQLIIGGWWQQDVISINGKIDEYRLYNRVLNADEIASLAQNFQDY